MSRSPASALPTPRELQLAVAHGEVCRSAARRVARHTIGNLIHPIALQLQLLERRLHKRPEAALETVETLRQLLDDARRGLAALDAGADRAPEPSARLDANELLGTVQAALGPDAELAVDLAGVESLVAPPETLACALTVLARALARAGATRVQVAGAAAHDLELRWHFEPLRLQRDELDDLLAEVARWPGLRCELQPSETPELGGVLRFSCLE